MAIQDLGDWLDEQMQRDVVWYVKRLSANDTQATGGHQAGFYLPKATAFSIIPSLDRPAATNPRVEVMLRIESHADVRVAKAIWYNNRLRGGTRNEVRITGLGGSASPLLDPEATGALVVFAFRQGVSPGSRECRAWVCDHAVEEDLIEERIGPVEPGQGRTWPDLFTTLRSPQSCWLEPEDIPAEWLDGYPPTGEMIRRVVELRPGSLLDVDRRLIKRRDCEFELSRSIEHAVEFPRVRAGYAIMDDCPAHARSALQGRGSRSGNSLELHVRQILQEEELVEGRNFDYRPESEMNKRPDFLFPNASSYHNPAFPDRNLMMLAVETTLRDRWRHILNEADRIARKHIITLQEGVSERQFAEMRDAGVQLVAPRPLHARYPRAVQPYLQTLESFLGDIRLLPER